MRHSKRQKASEQGTIIAKHGYEQSVIARATNRAGANPQLKGHIHEILVKDAKNARNLLKGNGATTQLTKSTTASTVDLVTVKGGKVIERIQAKDVTSQSGINKLVQQCTKGKYRSAQLVGSKETTQAFNKAAERAGISKRMTSTKVSSKDSMALAQRAGATGSGSLGSAMAQAAKTGGLAGAVVAGGVEAIKGCSDLINGNANAMEVAGRVTKASARGGISGAAAGAAATAAGKTAVVAVSGLGMAGAATAATAIVAPVVAAIAVGYVVSEAVDFVCDLGKE